MKRDCNAPACRSGGLCMNCLAGIAKPPAKRTCTGCGQAPVATASGFCKWCDKRFGGK